MKSARRTAYIKRKSKNSNSWTRKFVFPIYFLVLLFALFVFVKIDTRFWNGHDKFAFAFREESGDIGVTVLDPKTSEMVTLTIPGDTEVDVAKGYGVLRLKNVWQLSQNEKLSGSLLPKTIAKNFYFPVFLFTDSSIDDPFAFVFKSKETNIPLGDRLSAAYFSSRVKNLDKVDIDLGKSQFLHKETLKDGLSGYRLTGQVSERLTIYFSDDNFANSKIYIVDETGTAISQTVGNIMEVMGGKVVSIDKTNGMKDLNCEVLGKDNKIVKKVANLFTCKIVSGKTDFDLEMRIGTQFSKNF